MLKAPGKEHLIHRQFTLPEGYSVKSFVVREIDGHDEQEAARWLGALGTADDMATAIMEVNLRMALVSVDGKFVEQPYTGLKKWTSKTRRLLIAAWEQLNDVPDEDLAVFLAAAEIPQTVADQDGVLDAESLPSAQNPT